MNREVPQAGAINDPSEGSLLNAGFIGLTFLFFLTSSAMAAFFQLHSYLQSIQVSPAWIGFIIGADSLASFVVQPICAPYLHPGNGRFWMAVGIVVMAASLLAYSSGKSLGALVVIRITQGAGFVCFLAAMMATIVGYIPPSQSGRGFGFLSLVRLLPYAVVPPAMTSLMARSISFPVILVGFALLIACSLVLLFFVRPTVGPRGDKQSGGAGPVGFRETMEGLKDRWILALLAINLLVFMCYTVVFFYISGYGRYAGIPGTGLFFTIATLMMVVVRLFGSTFFDRFDKSRITAWCLAVLATAFFFLPYGTGWAFYILASIFGIGWGAIMPLLNAMVFDASLPHLRGVNLNMALVTMQGGFFLGPLAGGLVLVSAGYATLFVLCCPLSLLALAFLALKKQQKG
ncbi:MAG: Major Facilitator Superfamily protein [Syntrophorhabdus sp. PtaU1.Bin153]|nr:MAG: Major Facilitator Superfamily protein [Syntrophorhabdus sp. PtaU1.Bin153]